MTFSSFGKIFRFTTWGESHGKAIGCVIDGVPSMIDLSEDDIQYFLNQRKPGSSEFVSQRSEDDKVEILSGLFNNKTTGAPISLIIHNKNHHKKDYDNIIDKFRPGHGDFPYYLKYKIYDPYGGGRFSARETACRVAAGAIARKILGSDVKIKSFVTKIGEHDIEIIDEEYGYQNPFRIADPRSYDLIEKYFLKIKEQNSSVASKIRIIVTGAPPGLGEPIYDKLDSDIAKAMMSINAVKSVQIGEDPFVNNNFFGENFIDEMIIDSNDKVKFLSNNSGGIIAGISTGQDIIVDITVKPTSSINKELRTISKDFTNTTIKTEGRHDPCIGTRATFVAEAMMANLLADHLLRNRIWKKQES